MDRVLGRLLAPLTLEEDQLETPLRLGKGSIGHRMVISSGSLLAPELYPRLGQSTYLTIRQIGVRCLGLALSIEANPHRVPTRR